MPEDIGRIPTVAHQEENDAWRTTWIFHLMQPDSFSTGPFYIKSRRKINEMKYNLVAGDGPSAEVDLVRPDGICVISFLVTSGPSQFWIAGPAGSILLNKGDYWKMKVRALRRCQVEIELSGLLLPEPADSCHIVPGRR
jgi:hypothetical protein